MDSTIFSIIRALTPISTHWVLWGMFTYDMDLAFRWKTAWILISSLHQSKGRTKGRPVPSTSCDLYICKVWSCYVQQFNRCIYKKIHYFPWPKTLLSTLYIVWPIYMQKSKDLWENTISRKVMDGWRTDFGTKSIYLFSYDKSQYKNWKIPLFLWTTGGSNSCIDCR